MKSPVSHVNVSVRGSRAMSIGGLPLSARTRSKSCHTAAGWGTRMLSRCTAGSMDAEPTRTYVRMRSVRQVGMHIAREDGAGEAVAEDGTELHQVGAHEGEDTAATAGLPAVA